MSTRTLANLEPQSLIQLANQFAVPPLCIYALVHSISIRRGKMQALREETLLFRAAMSFRLYRTM